MDEEQRRLQLNHQRQLRFPRVYMVWETYDGNTQFEGKLELWNMRLIFQTGRISDDGFRICHPKLWQFQAAYNGWDSSH